MTGLETLLARVTLGLVAAMASVSLALSPRWKTVSQRRFDWMVYGCFAISRLGLFTVVFLMLSIAPRGDVPAYYLDQARQVLHHRVPYRDFVSSYAPLHAYLDAMLISLWHSPLAIMLFSLLAELLILPLWMRAAREFLPEGEVRVASLLYLASPISLQFVAIDGQDNVVIALLLAAAVFLSLRSRLLAAGAALGASIAGIKFLPLLYAPAFLAAIPRRGRFAVGALLILGGVYGGFLLGHIPILMPFSAEGDLWSAGDLPYLFEAIFGVAMPPRWTDGFLLLVLLTLFLCVGRAARGVSTAARMRALTFGMAALTLALLALSKKSWPPYLMLALFPICLSVSGGAARQKNVRIGLFATFSLVAVTEHSYWASLVGQSSSAGFHRALLSHQANAMLLLAMELLLIGGYLWLLYESMGRVLSAPCDEPSPLETAQPRRDCGRPFFDRLGRGRRANRNLRVQ